MSFIDHLYETEQHDNVIAAMDKMGLELIDRDMGNVYVVRDTHMGDLTNGDHTFDVRIHDKGIEVHAHNDADAKRADAIRHELADAHIGVVAEATDERREKLKAAMMAAHKQEQGWRDAANKRAKERAAKMEKEHGPDWRKKLADKEAAERKAHNEKVMKHNEERKAKHAKMKKEMSPEEWKKYTDDLDRTADSYAGRRKGSNWTGD